MKWGSFLGLVLSLAALAFVGCGHRGHPIPPAPRVPETPRELSWHQRGDELEISASYTIQRRGGGALKGSAHPSLLAFVAPSESMITGWESESRDREFLRIARAFPLPGFGDVKHGTRVTRTDRVPISLFKKGAGIVLALTLEDERSHSLPSRRTVLQPARPGLKEPTETRVEAQERQVVISWSPPDDSRVTEVRVYKRLVNDAAKAGDWTTLGTYKKGLERAIDKNVSYGQRLQYALTSTRSSRAAIVESALVTLDALRYVDTFAPKAAFDLEAVAESGKIHVLWFPGGSVDEQLAVVERQREGIDEWQEVAQISIPDADFIDHDVSADFRYRYRITTVDSEKNRSTPTDASRWIAPRPSSERRSGGFDDQ